MPDTLPSAPAAPAQRLDQTYPPAPAPSPAQRPQVVESDRGLTTIRCEKHGLRYNPNVHSGCVKCRKEAGEEIGKTPTGPMAAGAPAAAAGRQEGMLLPALGVTVLLIVVTGGSFFWAHSRLYDFLLDSGFDPDTFSEMGSAADGFDDTGFDPELEPLSESDSPSGRGGELSDEDEKVIDRR